MATMPAPERSANSDTSAVAGERSRRNLARVIFSVRE
jgi:hypothetical protein